MAAGRKLWFWVFLGVPLVSTIIWFALNSARLHPEKITLAEAYQPVFALIYIAEEKGYFDEEGLDITYRSFTSAMLPANVTAKMDSGAWPYCNQIRCYWIINCRK